MKWLAIGMLLLCGIAAALGVIDFGSTNPSGHYQGRLVITGSSTVAPLVNEMAKRFEAQNSAVRIDVQTGGSSRGIADVVLGTSDIGMASRSLSVDESNLFAHMIASDGVCLILHAENPVDSLSNDQVVRIYTGQITNWKQLGGNDAPIVVVTKAEGRATLDVFLRHYEIRNPDIVADVVIGDNEQGIKTVVGNVNAIAFVSIGTAEYDREHGVSIKLIPTENIEASTRSLAAGSYPVSRPLILITKKQPTGLSQAFINFCQSQQVHDLIESQYFVPSTN